MTRLYVPATLADLAALDRHGSLPVGDTAVTARDDTEDEEYDALTTAAETSALLAAGLDPGARRRVVIVVEPPEGASSGDAISLADVVAVHADPEDLPDGFTDHDPEDLPELAWYATQEISQLLG